MCHDVDAPAVFPAVVHRDHAALLRCRVAAGVAEADTRIGHEEVDRSELAFDRINERLDRGFVADVEHVGHAADLPCDRCRGFRLEFGNDHPGTVAGKAPAQGAANAVAAPGNDGDTDFRGHSFLAAVVGRFRNCVRLKASNILYAQEVVQCCAF